VPTTAGTSADVSQFSIITNSAKKVKFAIISKAMVPDIALIDPQTTLSMDPYLTACTGMDALVHAIEAIVSTASSPLTDIHAFEAIRLISKNLVQAVRHPENGEYRDSMMRASLEAGLAFSNASLGAVHAMAHSLGGLMDMPHGECNAILLEPVIDYNYAYASERYALVAVCLGIDVSALSKPDIRNALLAEIRSLSATVGITARLADQGVEESSLLPLATNALADPCMVTNPRAPVLSEIVEVYRNAL
jgi:alcohol dehydrogenase class IV